MTREEIEQAAEKAGIADLVRSLEHGYDTPIGEGGRGLSGGEKQRVAIARAFLKKPSVILFDEPTTGLDLRTEQILQASMAELSKSSTVITVAHRLHTIKKADKLLFLENGELLATGTHEELIQRSGCLSSDGVCSTRRDHSNEGFRIYSQDIIHRKKGYCLFNHLRIYSWDHSCYFVCCERIYDF